MSVYSVGGRTINNCYSPSGNIVNDVYNVGGKSARIEGDSYLQGRLLLFEDDFDSNDLDNSNWYREVGKVRGDLFFRKENVYIEDKKLVLVTKKEKYLDGDITVAGVISRGRRSWLYGRFEAKMMVIGSNIYPSFWCLGTEGAEFNYNDDGTRDFTPQGEGVERRKRWSYCGEIDIMEMTPPLIPVANLWGASGQSLGGKFCPYSINENEWHVYAMEWTPDYIAMLIDGFEYGRYTFSDFQDEEIAAYINEPMNLIFGASTPEFPQSITEMKLYVDWFRVYAPLDTNKIISDTSIHIQETLRIRKGNVCMIDVLFTPQYTSDRRVIWISDDSSIARCDHGYVYGIELGETNIYAISINGNVSKCHVTVINQSDPIILETT